MEMIDRKSESFPSVPDDRELAPAFTDNRSSSTSTSMRARAMKHHRALVVGLLNGRVVWHEREAGHLGCIRDLWFYLCQVHPLLCVFFANPAHPFMKLDRFLHLLAMLQIAFFLSALTQLNYGEMPLESPQKIRWILVTNIILLVLDLGFRELATCSCVQPGGKFAHVSSHLTRLWAHRHLVTGILSIFLFLLGFLESCGCCCSLQNECAALGKFWFRLFTALTFCLAVIG